MATFPALKPSSRTFTPGVRPHSQIRTMDGGQSRVRQSNVLVDQRLRLTFAALTETQMLSIRTHYIGQQGRFLSFDIPNDLLSGTTNPANFTPTGYSWVYASTPSIQDVGCQRYTVSLELVTVPPEGVNVNGLNTIISTSFAGGAAIASTDVNIPLTSIALAAEVPIVVASPDPPLDPDTTAYVAAVEAADGQALETAVKVAIDNFVTGCKADGIWTAIKACCILSGARTFAGARVPLVGPAPTNVNFVNGDYNRKLGLSGSTAISTSAKYLNTNFADNGVAQNSCHISLFSTRAATTQRVAIGVNGIGRYTQIMTDASYKVADRCRSNGNLGVIGSGGLLNFAGLSRASSTQFTTRVDGANTTRNNTSVTPSANNFHVFADNPNGGSPAGCDVRLTFYSIGESLNLALLDARVSSLKAAIDAAIP